MVGLKATFCPCFVYGKTQARYRDPNLAGYSSFNEDCLAFAGLNACCGLGWVYDNRSSFHSQPDLSHSRPHRANKSHSLHLIRRREVGTQYRLEGEPITDCLLSSFCNCCSLIQVDKEIIAQHAKTGLAGTGGYVKPEGMVAGPPPV